MNIHGDFQYIDQPPPGQTLSSRHVVVADGAVLYCRRKQCIIFNETELQSLDLPTGSQFLGLHKTIPCYVAGLDKTGVDALALPEELEWRPLRSLLGKVTDDYFNWAGRACQIQEAYENHRFCGRCGNQTEPLAGERATHCEQCSLSFYPRLSPCVITVVTRGEYCLLARSHGWNNWFSALAGFVEPGENVEQALHREVYEEVGLRVKNIAYFGSQPWPFPGQLMLGFHAEYESGDIVLEEKEIAEAGWYHYSEMPPHPDTRTLSGQLIEHFVSRFR